MSYSKKNMVIHINRGLFPAAFVLLLCYKVCNLISLPGTFGASTNELLVMGVSLIFCLSYIMRYGFKYIMNYQYSNFIVLIFMIILFQFFYTIIRYPEESIVDTMAEASTYLTILSYYVFAKYSRKHGSGFFLLIINMAIFVALLYIVNAVLYNSLGQSILQIYGFNYGTIKDLSRTGNVRLVGPALIDFTTYIAIGALFQENVTNKIKRHCIYLIVVDIIYNLYVSQTRSTLLILAIIVIVILAKSKNKSSLVKILLALTSGILLIIVIMMLREMLKYSSSEYSIYHRIEAIQFYWERFCESPLFGNGLLRENPASMSNYYLVHGNQGYTYIDVGVFGLIGHYGLLGVTLYGVFLMLVYKNAKKRGKGDTISLALLLACILSAINLSLFDAGRISTLAMYLALMDSGVREQIQCSTLQSMRKSPNVQIT